MENEMFDEARKCMHCGIVTYCDNCPSCGRKLSRTNKTVWALRHGMKVAGEEDNVSQTMDNGNFQERAKVRDDSRKQRGDTLFHDGHPNPQVNLYPHKDSSTTSRYNDSTFEKKKQSTGILIIPFIIVIVILGVLIFKAF